MRTYSELQLKQLLGDKNILAVSHDAGSAQLLSSLIKRIKSGKISCLLGGPARDVFSAKLPGMETAALTNDTLNKVDVIITGTSVKADLERQAIAAGKAARKHCISMMDHWVHYREKFMSSARQKCESDLAQFLPDEIWLSDLYAYKTALSAGFPEEKLALVENFYLLEVSKNMPALKINEAKKNILYICESIYDDVKHMYGDGDAWGYNEYDLITDAVESLPLLENYINKIIFRLHPKDDAGKYDRLVRRYDGRMKIELSSFNKTPLEADLMQADYVVGNESMALVIALMLKKQVFSCVPKKAKRPCALPHKEVIHIHSLKEVVNHLKP